MEMIFNFANLYIMPFWALMIFLPRWRITRKIMRSLWVFVPLALAYTVLVLPEFSGLLASLSNPSLADLGALLSTPQGVTIGWLHFLAFDLFVGRWALFDSIKRGVPWYLTSIALVFTLLFGPFGFLLYFVMRMGFSRGQNK